MKQAAMYEQDFYAWSMQTAALIRQGCWSEIDALNLAEEIETMGRSEKRELINRLAILMMHLLKWQFQSERRSCSWEGTIDEQRQQVHDLLEDSPSLTYELETKLPRAYSLALAAAVRETGLPKTTFPTSCPYTLVQLLAETFLPE